MVNNRLLIRYLSTYLGQYILEILRVKFFDCPPRCATHASACSDSLPKIYRRKNIMITNNVDYFLYTVSGQRGKLVEEETTM